MSLVPSGKEPTARSRIGTASAARPCWIRENPSAFRLTPSPEEGGGEDAGLAWLSAAGAAPETPPSEAASELPLLLAPSAPLPAFASFFGFSLPPAPPPSAIPAAVSPARTTKVTASTAAARERGARAGGAGGRKGSRRGAVAVI